MRNSEDRASIELTIHIAAPRERCFDLARSVELHTHSTASTGERAIAGRTSGLLALGDEVTWRARHFGVWQTLTSRITAYERPAYFRDSMVRGAFARLDREPYFAEDGRGWTVMRDVFSFAAPFRVLGRVAERLIVTRYLRRFLEARNREIKVVAESDAWTQFVPPASDEYAATSRAGRRRGSHEWCRDALRRYTTAPDEC